MRLIQATIPPGALPAVEQALTEDGVDYFVTAETATEEYGHVLYISLPEEDVEAVLETLYSAGLDSEDHVLLIDTEVDIFGRADGAASEGGGYARIASAELEGKTEDLIPDLRTFVTMMLLSTIVATTGVLLDSPAVVVGSMVLAPLFGPAVSSSVGTVIDEQGLFWQGIQLQVLGVVLAVGGAAAFALLMRTTYLLPGTFAVTSAPQIVDRLSPDLLSLVVALAAGIAGVVSIATAAGRALVGVMMAAALLPPAAIVGIGIAWGSPGVVLHSAILLTVNLLAINLAGHVTLWYLGYRPQSWIQIPETRRSILKRGAILFVAILLTSAFLWNVTYANVQRSELETAIEDDLQELLANETYGNVTLMDVSVNQDQTALRPKTESVTVTLGRPPGETHHALHREIDDRIEQRVGEEVTVDIRVSLLLSESTSGTGERRLDAPFRLASLSR